MNATLGQAASVAEVCPVPEDFRIQRVRGRFSLDFRIRRAYEIRRTES